VRCAVICAALAGCIPVSYSTSPSRIRDAAPTLRRDGTATVVVDESDDHPAEDSAPAWNYEAVRLDQPIRVRLTPQPGAWSSTQRLAEGSEETMTVADLLADCPADLDNSEANRRTHPRCRLFRADEIQLHHGHRADKWKMVLAGTIVAAAGDIVCIVECGKRTAEAATDIGIASLGAAGAVAALGFLFYELTKDDDPKHGY
jgi:hypothetical protein